MAFESTDVFGPELELRGTNLIPIWQKPWNGVALKLTKHEIDTFKFDTTFQIPISQNTKKHNTKFSPKHKTHFLETDMHRYADAAKKHVKSQQGLRVHILGRVKCKGKKTVGTVTKCNDAVDSISIPSKISSGICLLQSPCVSSIMNVSVPFGSKRAEFFLCHHVWICFPKCLSFIVKTPMGRMDDEWWWFSEFRWTLEQLQIPTANSFQAAPKSAN